MSIRKGYKDIIEEETIVRIVIDLSGIKEKELQLKISSDKKRLLVKHTPSGSILEIQIPCEIEKQFTYTFNNGVLDVEIKKWL